MNFTLETLMSIAALVGSLMAIYVSWRKVPHEVKKTDSDVVVNYEEAATSALRRASEAQVRLHQLEQEMEVQGKAISDLKQQLQERDLLIAEWTHGIDLLIHQISAMDTVPVWKPRNHSDKK